MSLDARGTQRVCVDRNLSDPACEEVGPSAPSCIVGLGADHFRQVVRPRVDCKRNWRTRYRRTINEQHNLRAVIGHGDMRPTTGGDDSTGTVNHDPAREVSAETTPSLCIESESIDHVLAT